MDRLNEKLGRYAARAVLIGWAAWLAGCASTPMMRAEVTRFHRFEEQPPRSFSMGTASARAASLEYRSYADLVRRQLVALGFTEAAPEAARYRIEFDAQVQAEVGRAVAFMPPLGPAFGGGYGWPYGPWPGPGRPGPYRWPAYPSGWGGPAYAAPMDVPVSVHTLRLSIIEALPAAGAPPRTVFESSAVARTLEPALPQLMPALVEAVFRGFPGVDGTTQVIEVPLPPASGAAAQPVTR
jgi:hypothetical protein